MTGRPLRPPQQDTALDLAWQRRQWRLERAHDDWGLHATSGDPRAPIHRASGLVRLCRQSVQDKIRSYRQTVPVERDGEVAANAAKAGIVDAIRNYRLAVADLARTVAAFDKRNTDVSPSGPKGHQGSRETSIMETAS